MGTRLYRKNDDGREDVKMDAKEAIKVVKSIKQATQDYYDRHKGFYDTADAKEDVEKELAGINVAISALEKVETLEAENARLREKETPKEPIYVKEGDAYCPICGDSVNAWLGDQFISDEFISYKFCSNCGQAIKNDKE